MRKTPASRPDEPASLNYARIVCELLTNPQGWRVGTLKSDLGIKDRTYRHYRQVLQERFFPFHNASGESMIVEEKRGPEKYLCLRDRTRLVEGRYGHVVALHFALRLFEFVRDTSLWPAIESVFEEFRRRAGMKALFGHVFRNADRLFHYQPFAPKDYSKCGPSIDSVIRALIQRQRIKILYSANPDSPRKEHLLEPLSLVLYLGGLYLIARYAGSRKPYQFLVDRIEVIHLQPETFSYPSDREYTPSMFYEDSFGGFIEKGQKLLDVELVFAGKPWLKQYLRERLWHRSQRFTDLPDGRLRLRLRASGRLALARWVRMFGDDVAVVQPADLLEPDQSQSSARPDRAAEILGQPVPE